MTVSESASRRTNECVPVITRSSLLSSKAHIRMVESSLAVAKRPSFGLKLRPRIASRCPCHAVKLFIFGWKYLMIPLWSAEAKYAPECVNWKARIAESWACKIVSKLNVRPFQRVNSPLVDPVSTRRPSGVHCNHSKLTWSTQIISDTDRYNVDRTAYFIC